MNAARALLALLLLSTGTGTFAALDTGPVDLEEVITPDELAAESGLEPYFDSESEDESGAGPYALWVWGLKMIMGAATAPVDPDAGLTVAELNERDRTRSKVVAVINKATQGDTAQRLILYVDGEEVDRWEVSTGREKWETAKSGKYYKTSTPTGYYRPTRVEEEHYSQTWKANLRWVVFFVGGVAVHATSEDHYPELGKRASGGCVRLTLDHADTFFHQVENAGKAEVPALLRNGTYAMKNGATVQQTNWDTTIIVRNRQDE